MKKYLEIFGVPTIIFFILFFLVFPLMEEKIYEVKKSKNKLMKIACSKIKGLFSELNSKCYINGIGINSTEEIEELIYIEKSKILYNKNK